ncbi:MAG: rRNA maturation RNase YbeY [Salibacteraceae bacterium]
MISDLQIYIESSADWLVGLKPRLESVLNELLSQEEKSCEWLSVILLSTEDHKVLNSKYLGHDYATDVLTFDYSDNDAIAGEIYIDEMVMMSQAVEYNVTTEQEFARLVIHGLLHLLGYDDGELKDQKIMKSREDELVRLFQT